MEGADFKFAKPGTVRVRIAPSPTGFMHIGLARTALFNYLFAKKHQGVFILRIEDTDIERSRQEYEKDIIDNLEWLGIPPDEGPIAGGEYGPYRQSEKKEVYKEYLERLIAEKKAYFCFCLEEDLKAHRQYLMSIGQAPRYSGKCANLSEKEVKKKIAEGKKPVIRFRVPAQKIVFEDMIREKVEFDTGLIGDIIIAKDFYYPLYNFAVVIDDFNMKISHVIRGEEHLSNTPKQILIQEALGFPQLKYAHLPLVLGPDKSKMSKRHGSVAVRDYKEAGYLPETMINFLAFLGWNPGTEREIFSLASLNKEFSLDRVQKGGAVFNIQRLDYLNGFYIRQKSIDELVKVCIPYLVRANLITSQKPEVLEQIKFKVNQTSEEISLDNLKRIISIYQQRLRKISEIAKLTDFFFKEKLEYEKDLLRWKKMEDSEIVKTLDKLTEIFDKIKDSDFNKGNLDKLLQEKAEEFNRKIGKKAEDKGYLLWPLRVALTGKKASAGPFEIAEILGKEKVLARIKEAKELLK